MLQANPEWNGGKDDGIVLAVKAAHQFKSAALVKPGILDPRIGSESNRAVERQQDSQAEDLATHRSRNTFQAFFILCANLALNLATLGATTNWQ